MAFNPERVDPSMTAAQLAVAINKIQANIAKAFAEGADQLAVKPVASSSSVTLYNVSIEDRFLLVDSRGGPIKIAFPDPTVNQEVTILNITDSKNKVTAARQNGAPFGNGDKERVIAPKAWADFLSDSKEWF